MATVQVHKFDSGSTNYIELNYKVTGTRPNLNTLNISFTNLSLSMPAKYTNSSGEKVDNEGTFSYWLGVWPKIVLKNGSKKVYTYDFQIDDITNGTHTFDDGRGTRKVLSNLNKALVVKPYIQNHKWTSYTGDHTTLDIPINLSGLTESQKKGIDTAELYVQCYSFHCCVKKSGSYESWGGCPCADHNEDTSTDLPIEFWTEISAGSIDIVDNGNNTFTVSGKNGKGGINNALKSGTLNTVLGIEGVSFSLVDVETNDTLAGTTNEDNFSRTYRISDPDDKIGDAGVITVTSKITNVPSQSKDKSVYAQDEKVIKFYKAPKWNKNTANLTFTSGDSGQYNNRPRLKKPLKWAWTGATPGNTASHNVIRGYQIYICNGGGGTNKAVGLYPYRGKFTLNSGNTSPGAKVFETSTDDSTGAYAYVINRGTTNNTLVTNGSGNISFTPIDLDFASKNICYCRVRPFSYWGNRVATKELGSDGNKATYTQYAKNYGPWLIGICTADGSDTTATYIKGTQCVLSNGAVVWVRIHDPAYPDNPNKLKWAEGTVYVYHDSEWKEAEGVYVRDGGKWKEST